MMLSEHEDSSNDELTVDELKKRMKIFREPPKKQIQLKFKRIEPDIPPIKELPGEACYQKKFWENYKDELKLNAFGSNSCTTCGKFYAKPKDNRRHTMTHFDSEIYDKFNCTRCFRNFATYQALKNHIPDRCFISSEFPKHDFFIRMCLAENPQQKYDATTCSNCKKEFKVENYKSVTSIPYYTRIHFASCIRFPYHCPTCDSTFSKYTSARIHYEQGCDGDTKLLRHYHEKITPPSFDDIDKEWNEEMMMNLMRLETLPHLRKLIARYPVGSLLLIGQTQDVRKRDKQYNVYKVTVRRAELEPYLNLNDIIVFRAWSRFDVLLFEYLLQYNLVDEDGEFFEEFGELMNKQTYTRPIKTEENSEKNRPYYVYVKATKKPWTLADANNWYHEELPEEIDKENTLNIETSNSATSKELKTTATSSLQSISAATTTQPQSKSTAATKKFQLKRALAEKSKSTTATTIQSKEPKMSNSSDDDEVVVFKKKKYRKISSDSSDSDITIKKKKKFTINFSDSD
ncbi:hypothetical protein PVAND_004791 [Polypedilum vanderplanki]|uniref:C2H2-type domain-containing protein n=1 Tax=Polypedilum vanderplanki TaxID=319348 RepID=A0A9J6C056_POLVA|nr:hypothetical protein PVAND_004791 [Polypedilum vanderplanki]